jgi:hypothetical protein
MVVHHRKKVRHLSGRYVGKTGYIKQDIPDNKMQRLEKRLSILEKILMNKNT